MGISKEELKIINEPFTAGRGASRLLFDFGIMLSCFKDPAPNERVLDFAAGSGWISEWLNRMGYKVVAFDLSRDICRILRLRIRSDWRLQQRPIDFQCGDGHEMPFRSGCFGHICCFDSLHHMRDYGKALSEFHRILAPGGRAIFIEPGARHSTAKETIDFINRFKKDDPTWIERDVVIEEIHRISQQCGFRTMKIRPVLFPELKEYDFAEWQKFREGDPALTEDYVRWLKTFNYESRVCFYLEKAEGSGRGASPLKEKLRGIGHSLAKAFFGRSRVKI